MENFVNNTRLELEKFAKVIQTPHAKDALLKSIEQERLKKYELQTREENLKRNIKFLNDRIPIAMKVHCDELGIKNTPSSIVEELGALLQKHQELSAYSLQLEAALHSNQRSRFPPVAHSNNNQSLPSPYMRESTTSATLDLSLATKRNI